jgi:putative ABC transport system permease protein
MTDVRPARRAMGARAYDLLLRAWPRAFRERYGDALRADYESLANEGRHRGVAGRLRLWRLLVADALSSGTRERRNALRDAPAEPDPHLAYGGAHAAGDRMQAVVQDVRYALRSLRRTPAFLAVVIVSLALGIGANALIYSVLDGVLLRPYPYPDADRLVAVGVAMPRVFEERQYIETLSPPEFVDIRSGAPSLERHTVFDLGNRNLTGGDRPERVMTAFTWGDPFATIGLSPVLGRGFTSEETLNEGAAVAVLSHRVWTARFAADSSLVGRAVQVNGRAVTIVGIMPPTLLLLGSDLWMPMGMRPEDFPRQGRQFAIVARLRAGRTLEQANAELRQVASRVEREHRAERPEYEGWSLRATPWAAAITDRFRTAGFLLQGAVALVLLIACANVAGLLVSRAATRQREIAVRRALGAGGWRIARQLLTESLLLGLAGGVAGIAIAAALTRPVEALLPEQLLAGGLRIVVNTRVILVATGVSLLAGFAFGLAPAIQLLRRAGRGTLGSEGTRTTIDRGGRRVRAGFLVAQVALSVVLLAGAGVLARSMQALNRVDPGFEAGNVLLMRLSLPRERYDVEQIATFFEELAGRITALPGVRGASAATQFPPINGFQAPMSLEGEDPSRGSTRLVDVTNATEGHFRTMGFALREGRTFLSTDTRTSPPVAVMNETAARRAFGTTSPVGKRVRLDDAADAPFVEIVGVVRDARNRGLDAPAAPELFVPVRQQRAAFNNQLFVLVRTQGDPMALLPAVRRTVAELDPQQPLYAIDTLEGRLGDAMLQRRAAALFIGIFAGIAVVLAAVGIYGLVTYTVNERVKEIGIRMALGADAARVRRLILRQTMTIVGAGAVLGVAGAFAAGGAMRRLAFGVSATDPLTIAGVTALLLVVGVVATLAPTRRATRLPPTLALREG